MVTTSRAVDEVSRKLRADQIMDAAAELLLKWGYGKVTIDDVAREARVGKGTVYLHWKNREELFYSVVLREQLKAVDEQVEAIRRDPREALLHRLVRMKAVSALRRPLLKAVVASDPDVLGRLLESLTATDLARLAGGVSIEYFQVLSDHRLIRDDLPMNELLYAIGAVTIGFFTGDRYLGAFGGLPSPEARVQMLEDAVERTFGLPPTEEALRKVAPVVIAMFQKMLLTYHDYLAGAYRANSADNTDKGASL
jgi:AcrR family transcriptional regulator